MDSTGAVDSFNLAMLQRQMLLFLSALLVFFWVFFLFFFCAMQLKKGFPSEIPGKKNKTDYIEALGEKHPWWTNLLKVR